MSEHPDRMLLTDPTLSYINQILMDEEEEDDAAGMILVNDSSYQAIFSSFCEILYGKGSEPISCDESSGGNKASDACPVASKGSDNIPPQGHFSFGTSGLFLGHSSHHEGAEVGFTQKHAGSGLQGHVLTSHDKRTGMLDAGDRRRIMAGQEQGNDVFKLPLTDEELCSKLAEIELSYKEFKLDDVNSDLYVHDPARASQENKSSGGNRMGRKASKAGKFEPDVFVDVEVIFSNLFDLLYTVWGDDPQRQVLERSCFYREILNIVGCEGAERVGRPETYKEWHARITKAGFEQLPLLSTVVSRSRSHVKQLYHKDFLLYDDGKGWMLMGWKGCTMLGVSAWKPRLV